MLRAMKQLTRPSVPVLLAAAAAALHVVDDNLVDPGWARAGDHVVSTVVPLAVVGLLAWLTTRGRPGTRAGSALGLGVVTLTLGAESAFHATSDGLAGDDFTGLLCLAAGVALVVLSVRDLWRSRRRDGSRTRRLVRRTAKGFVALVLT